MIANCESTSPMPTVIGRPTGRSLCVWPSPSRLGAGLHRERRAAQPADDTAHLQVPRQVRRAGDGEVVAVAAFLVAELLRRPHRPEVVLVMVDAVALAKASV